MLGHSFGVRWLWKILESTTLKIDCSYLVSPYLSDQQISSDWFKLQGDRYQVNWPKELQTGKEKFEYPMPFLDYFKMDQQEVDKRNVHLIEASDDEILSPLKNLNTKSHFIIPQATHMGIVMQPQNIDLICDFIESNTRG